MPQYEEEIKLIIDSGSVDAFLASIPAKMAAIRELARQSATEVGSAGAEDTAVSAESVGIAAPRAVEAAAPTARPAVVPAAQPAIAATAAANTAAQPVSVVSAAQSRLNEEQLAAYTVLGTVQARGALTAVEAAAAINTVSRAFTQMVREANVAARTASEGRLATYSNPERDRIVEAAAAGGSVGAREVVREAAPVVRQAIPAAQQVAREAAQEPHVEALQLVQGASQRELKAEEARARQGATADPYLGIASSISRGPGNAGPANTRPAAPDKERRDLAGFGTFGPQVSLDDQLAAARAGQADVARVDRPAAAQAAQAAEESVAQIRLRNATNEANYLATGAPERRTYQRSFADHAADPRFDQERLRLAQIREAYPADPGGHYGAGQDPFGGVENSAVRQHDLRASIAAGENGFDLPYEVVKPIGRAEEYSAESVDKVRFGDGSYGVRKVTGFSSEDQNEELVSKVGRAFGANVPQVVTEGAASIQRYIPGKTVNDYLGTPGGGKEFPGVPPDLRGQALVQARRAALRDSADGQRLDLTNTVVGNSDIHGGNQIVSRGRLFGIDHGYADFGASSRGDLPFFGGLPPTFADINSRELDTNRSNLDALKPDFEKYGRGEDFQYAQDQLAGIRRQTKADESVLGLGPSRRVVAAGFAENDARGRIDSGAADRAQAEAEERQRLRAPDPAGRYGATRDPFAGIQNSIAVETDHERLQREINALLPQLSITTQDVIASNRRLIEGNTEATKTLYRGESLLTRGGSQFSDDPNYAQHFASGPYGQVRQVEVPNSVAEKAALDAQRNANVGYQLPQEWADAAYVKEQGRYGAANDPWAGITNQIGGSDDRFSAGQRVNYDRRGDSEQAIFTRETGQNDEAVIRSVNKSGVISRTPQIVPLDSLRPLSDQETAQAEKQLAAALKRKATAVEKAASVQEERALSGPVVLAGGGVGPDLGNVARDAAKAKAARDDTQAKADREALKTRADQAVAETRAEFVAQGVVSGPVPPRGGGQIPPVDRSDRLARQEDESARDYSDRIRQVRSTESGPSREESAANLAARAAPPAGGAGGGPPRPPAPPGGPPPDDGDEEWRRVKAAIDAFVRAATTVGGRDPVSGLAVNAADSGTRGASRAGFRDLQQSAYTDLGERGRQQGLSDDEIKSSPARQKYDQAFIDAAAEITAGAKNQGSKAASFDIRPQGANNAALAGESAAGLKEQASAAKADASATREETNGRATLSREVLQARARDLQEIQLDTAQKKADISLQAAYGRGYQEVLGKAAARDTLPSAEPPTVSQGIGGGLLGGLGLGGGAGGLGAAVFGFQIAYSVAQQAFGSIKNLVVNAEAAQVALASVKTQLDQINSSSAGTNQGGSYKVLADSIRQTASDTGVAVPQVAALASEFLGLYGNVGQAATATADAAKIIRITGEDAATAGPQIAALAEDLGASTVDIGNSVVDINNKTGRSMSDALAAMSGISGVAQETGLSLTNVRGLIEAVLSTSAKSGQQIGEGLSRVLPQLVKNAPKVEALGVDFSPAAKAGDAESQLKDLISQYGGLSQTVQEQIVALLGGPRNAALLTGLFKDPTKSLAELNGALTDNNLLNERNAAVQETLSGALKRVSTEAVKLGEAFVNSGVGKALQDIASAAGVLLSILDRVFSLMATANKYTGGFAVGLVEVLVAFRALKALADLDIWGKLLKGASVEGGIGKSISGLLNSILGVTKAKDVKTVSTDKEVVSEKADAVALGELSASADTATVSVEGLTTAKDAKTATAGLGAEGAAGAGAARVEGAAAGPVEGAVLPGVEGAGAGLGAAKVAAGLTETALPDAAAIAPAVVPAVAPVLADSTISIGALSLAPETLGISLVAAAVGLTVSRVIKDYTAGKVKGDLAEYQKQVNEQVNKAVAGGESAADAVAGLQYTPAGVVAGTTLAGAKGKISPVTDVVRRVAADSTDFALGLPTLGLSFLADPLLKLTGHASLGTDISSFFLGNSPGTHEHEQLQEKDTRDTNTNLAPKAQAILDAGIATAAQAKSLSDDLADPGNTKKHDQLVSLINDIGSSPKGIDVLAKSNVKQTLQTQYDYIAAGTDATITSIADAQQAFADGSITFAQMQQVIQATITANTGFTDQPTVKATLAAATLYAKNVATAAVQSTADAIQIAKDIGGNDSPRVEVDQLTALLNSGAENGDPAAKAATSKQLITSARALYLYQISQAKSIDEAFNLLKTGGAAIPQAALDAENAAALKSDPTGATLPFPAVQEAEDFNKRLAAANLKYYTDRGYTPPANVAYDAAAAAAAGPPSTAAGLTTPVDAVAAGRFGSPVGPGETVVGSQIVAPPTTTTPTLPPTTQPIAPPAGTIIGPLAVGAGAAGTVVPGTAVTVTAPPAKAAPAAPAALAAPPAKPADPAAPADPAQAAPPSTVTVNIAGGTTGGYAVSYDATGAPSGSLGPLGPLVPTGSGPAGPEGPVTSVPETYQFHGETVTVGGPVLSPGVPGEYGVLPNSGYPGETGGLGVGPNYGYEAGSDGTIPAGAVLPPGGGYKTPPPVNPEDNAAANAAALQVATTLAQSQAAADVAAATFRRDTKLHIDQINANGDANVLKLTNEAVDIAKAKPGGADQQTLAAQVAANTKYVNDQAQIAQDRIDEQTALNQARGALAVNIANSHGDTVGAAQAQVNVATQHYAQITAPGYNATPAELAQGQADVVAATTAKAQAQATEAQGQFAYAAALATARGDTVAAARLQEAGLQAGIDALIASGFDPNSSTIKGLRAQKVALQTQEAQSLQADAQAQYSYYEAVDNAKGLTVEAAKQQANAIQSSIDSLKSQGYSESSAQLKTLRAQQVTQADAVVQADIADTENSVSTALALHKIGYGGAIQQLQAKYAAAKAAGANQKELDAISVQIQQYEQQASGQLNFNIGNITVPSLYAAKRLEGAGGLGYDPRGGTPGGLVTSTSGSPGLQSKISSLQQAEVAGSANSASIAGIQQAKAAYTDNRQQSIVIQINNAQDNPAALKMLTDAVGAPSRVGASLPGIL